MPLEWWVKRCFWMALSSLSRGASALRGMLLGLEKAREEAGEGPKYAIHQRRREPKQTAPTAQYSGAYDRKPYHQLNVGRGR